MPNTLGFLDDDGVFLLEKLRGDDFEDFLGDFFGDLSDVLYESSVSLLILNDLFFICFFSPGSFFVIFSFTFFVYFALFFLIYISCTSSLDNLK